MARESISELTDSISTNLLRRVKGHDEPSWQRLVNMYAPLIYGWCRRWGVPADDAPDIVQEVFQSIANSVDRFERREQHDTFRGWVWTISRNAFHRHQGRQRREPQGGGGTDQQLRIQAVPDADHDDGQADESVRLLYAMLDVVRNDFRNHTWDIFWRSAILGHETEEIAREYSMTAKAVRQAKHRVLNRLREECDARF